MAVKRKGKKLTCSLIVPPFSRRAQLDQDETRRRAAQKSTGTDGEPTADLLFLDQDSVAWRGDQGRLDASSTGNSAARMANRSRRAACVTAMSHRHCLY